MSENRSQAQSGGETAANPMAMGMAMAKKMMGGMGQGGPLEMMQKMMAQMPKTGGKPPMEMMMGMCAEMLNAIRQTNALAVHCTPELQELFGEWLKVTEDKVLDLITKGTTEAAAIAAALKLTEASVRYILTRLAEAGKITLNAAAAK
jgi:hypothetical protein